MTGPRVESDLLPLWREAMDNGQPLTHEHPQTNVRDALSANGAEIQRTASAPEPPHSNDLGRSSKDEDRKSNSSWHRSLGRRATTKSFDPEAALPDVESEMPLKPARNPPEVTIDDYIPLLKLVKWMFKKLVHVAFHWDVDHQWHGTRRKKHHPLEIESNVPLEICLYLSRCVAYFVRLGFAV